MCLFRSTGMPIPKEYGSSDAEPITTVAMMEGLGYGGSDQGLLFSFNAHMWTNSIPLLKIRHRGAETEISSPPMRRKFHRCQRRQRADRWLRYFFDANPRDERWQRLCSERQESVCD